jgi:ABC-2 type transport system ATP-binding protein
MIQVEQICKRYNGSRALDGFNLQVQPGEVVGLVGPNGAGKTTLIKILSTLLKSSGGKASIGGFDVARRRREVKKLVGYLPDSPGIYQEMRVREFLEFFADAFHLKRKRKRDAVAEALERAGLTERGNSFVEELSLGMRQRLLLAKTLLHRPKVLLLDEPATGLDPLARIHLREQLKQLQAEGVTVLISSHILNDLEDICTRVAMIAEGRNATDAEGRSVIELQKNAALFRTYEIRLVGVAETMSGTLQAVPGTQMLTATGNRLVVQVTGGDHESAALLHRLIESGAEVVSFTPLGAGLEERYRQAFGEEHQ